MIRVLTGNDGEAREDGDSQYSGVPDRIGERNGHFQMAAARRTEPAGAFDRAKRRDRRLWSPVFVDANRKCISFEAHPVRAALTLRSGGGPAPFEVLVGHRRRLAQYSVAGRGARSTRPRLASETQARYEGPARECAIRRLLFRLLAGYKAFTRWFRGLRGIDDAAVAERRVISGTSWDEFCDALKAAGAAVSGFKTPADPLTQAEGYRYLSRLTRAGLEAFVEYGDPETTALRRMVHETVKLGADNPDNHYFNASIDGSHAYRIVGTRGTVHMLTFSTQKGGYGEGGGLPPTGFLDSADLVVENDGRVEIFVTRNEQPKNWLPMDVDSGLLIVRQTFLNRDEETPADLRLERIGATDLPRPLSAEHLDRGLRRTADLVAGASVFFARWAADLAKHTNRLPRFDPARSTAAGGDPNIAYYHSYWQLAVDEALIIEATPPPCRMWNFQLNNHWMESLDYRYFTIHINQHTAQLNDDGSVRIVVAHRDPKVPNWIQTAGHTFGTMCFRWIHAQTHPEPRTRVVPFEEISR